MQNIEVEIRSFITEKQYTELLKYFHAHATFQGVDQQETIYFDAPVDVRIQQNNTGAKIWLKKGKLHDESREEIELKAKREDFSTLQKLFDALDYQMSIRWLRTRHTFMWNGTTVTVDYSKGYGYIVEFEQMSTAADKEKTLKHLKEQCQELSITVTPREEFDKKYAEYKENWRELLSK